MSLVGTEARQAPDGMVLIPKVTFSEPLENTLQKLSNAPTKKTSLTKLRKAPAVALPLSMFQDELSTSAGLAFRANAALELYYIT